MKGILTFFVLIECLLTSHSLLARCCLKTGVLETHIGPEIYHIYRIKDKGGKQLGTLYGARIGYNYIHYRHLYWGIDALWAKGILKGKMEENKLKSTFKDVNIEARFGYTFHSKYWQDAYFIPYLGLGYFWENNFYQSPSPLPIHFKNRFSYLPFGFFFQFFVSSNWSIGTNLKIRYLLEAKQYATNDPKHASLTQYYEENCQYRVELPIAYSLCWKKSFFIFSLTPFYEYRSYGYRVNFPFDFLETKLKLYGASLIFLYSF